MYAHMYFYVSCAFVVLMHMCICIYIHSNTHTHTDTSLSSFSHYTQKKPFHAHIQRFTCIHTEEFTKASQHPVVIFMPEGSKTVMGGTMRLGTRRTILKSADCMTAKLYGDTSVDERHRCVCVSDCMTAQLYVHTFV